MTKDRWIEQLDEMYWKIVKDPNIPTENLDKANNIILSAMEKLRPLTTPNNLASSYRSGLNILCGRCKTDEPEIRKSCTASCEEHERERTPKP